MTEPQTINDLDSYFKPESEDEVVGEEVEAEQAETEPNEPEDEDESKGEQDESEDQTEDEDETATPAEENRTVPIAALTDERRKRQAIEEELRQIRQQYAPPEPEAPDPVEDPDGYKAYVKNQAEAEMILGRIEQSRQRMLESTPDYEEMERTFLYLNTLNPELAKQMNASHDPAKFAYETAVQYRENEKAKLRAEIEAELSSQKPATKPKPKVPDLTKAAAKGGNTSKVELSDDLETYLGDRPY